ncbi:steroid receptor RNA activator 1-like [Uranotaenia lowii]|uniref:steroid receptor RNA activator 1-like n=1 Tax=Uranotaenia lowii TaxID=190385 RepID=UPI0024793C8D|nr:steroid receptor RNA activator 1-like [Uranotaenia lowii]
MSGENYRSATKSHDPGWNDPPKLSYNASAAQTSSPAGPPKLNLNKRVAFPVGKTSVQPQTVPTGEITSSLPQFVSGAPMAVPPCLLPTAPPISAVGTPPKSAIFTATPKITPSSDSNHPDEPEMLTFVEQILQQFILKLDTSKQGEIRKRLEVIQKSWEEGKFPVALKIKLYDFAKALESGSVTSANDIHRSVIVDHGTVCVQWAPALRQLVLAIPAEPGKNENECGESCLNTIVKPL